MTTGLGEAALVSYLLVLGLLSVNGLHRAWLCVHWLRRRAVIVESPPDDWPTVTVQLPVFNERDVVGRLIEHAGALDYPQDRLQIQVLDDSTDDTTQIAMDAVEQLRGLGVHAVVLHREDRTGFKAGALDAATGVASGDLLAVFDADFLPQPSFLKRMVPHFQDPGVGMVQARWGHINASQNWVTWVQSILLDGHFVIEHTARHASGRWFNFNGTAGIWRRTAIEDAGGWEHDTVTEDLDLSYRAQLRGWRFIYREDVVVPAELPTDMAAFKVQQHRWAKGSVQTCRKLIRRIWASDASLGHKMEATQHLTANFSYPVVVLLSLLMPSAVWARSQDGMTHLLALDAALFACAMLPFLAYYGLAIHGARDDHGRRRWVWLPAALAVGLGMAIAQSRAVWDGLSRMGGVFVRTPKSGGVRKASYRPSDPGLVALEGGMAAFLWGATGLTVLAGFWASVPFLILFSAGYSMVGLGANLAHRRASAAATAAPPQVIHQSSAGTSHEPVSGSRPSSAP